MNPQTFFDHFERLVDAPNAVPRLREMILQLAVQGKLVAQDEREEPASMLLEKIKAEKIRLVKEKKIGVQESLPTIEADDEPFRLPNGWQWVHLNQITNTVHYGYTASANHSLRDVRLLRITDIQNGKVDWDSVPGCEIDKDKIDGVELRDGDLLIARTGGTIGKSFLVENVSVRAVFASYLIRAVPNKFLFPKYLKLFLESELYWRQLYAKSMGTGQPNVNATSLKSLFVPLPPFEEQKRIVAKVDGLRQVCDELEQEQAERRISRSHINRAALDQLLAARYASEFSTRWQTVCDHFPTLTATPDCISKLRQTVLQLAVRGKLTWQGRCDRQSNDKQVSDYVKILNGYAFKSEWFVKGGVRLLRNANVGHGSLRWDEVVAIPTEQAEEFSRFALAEGDIVISLDRPLIATGIKVARVSVEDLPSLLLQRVGKVEFKTGEIDPDFFFMWLHSPLFINSIDPGRSNGVPHISSKSIEQLPLIVPPLEEQKRIITAVNSLMALCDELEANLRRAEEDGERLLRAAVRSLLASVSENSAAKTAALVVQ